MTYEESWFIDRLDRPSLRAQIVEPVGDDAVHFAREHVMSMTERDSYPSSKVVLDPLVRQVAP